MIGEVTLKVEKALLTRDTDSLSTMDAYVKFWVGN